MTAANNMHFGAGTGAPDWQDYAIGEHRIACPSCSRGGRDKTAGLRVESDHAYLHCFRCGLIETYRTESQAVRRQPTIKPTLVSSEKFTELSPWGRALWQSTRELSGIAVEYLRHRHCVIPPAYGALRWHSGLKHPSGYVGPCLVALVTDIHTDKPLSLHRTWITATGKADVNPPRLLLGNHAIAGGCIKLWPDADVGHTLGIAEGIETALSLAHCVTPVWSCIDAGHLERFPVMAGLTQLYIAQDSDPAGVKAATACATRYHAAGRYVAISNQSQNDINDTAGEAV